MTAVKKVIPTTITNPTVSVSSPAASLDEKKAFLSSVRPALITEETHPDLAKICPHLPVPGTDLLELAVINGNYVTKKEMQHLCCTQGELFSAAASNQKNDTVCFTTISEAMGIPPLPDEDNNMLYVLRIPHPVSGAAALLNREALQKASETIGGDFFILPSSIHEVLLIPSTELKPAELEIIVQSVNRHDVRPEEILSNHVYRYDCQTKKLSMAVEQHLYEGKDPYQISQERRCRR